MANFCIYDLKGDALKIVFDESGKKGRPASFGPPPDMEAANGLLLILKRVPPAPK